MQKSKVDNFKKFNARKYRVGLVVAQFNRDITDALLDGAIKMIRAYKIPDKNIVVKKVAGSIEIPLILQMLAKQKKFDCLVAIGAIIRGETPHFDYVAKIVSEGILEVMLDYDIPVGFGVLTLSSIAQAKARFGSGASAAEAALQSAKLLKRI